jgi:hypothetical protein
MDRDNANAYQAKTAICWSCFAVGQHADTTESGDRPVHGTYVYTVHDPRE